MGGIVAHRGSGREGQRDLRRRIGRRPAPAERAVERHDRQPLVELRLRERELGGEELLLRVQHLEVGHERRRRDQKALVLTGARNTARGRRAPGENYERVRPILEPLGSVRHTGGLGSGAAMKLVANLALGAAIVTLGEALSLGESLELKRDILLDALADSPIGPIVGAKRANVESGQFAPNFKLRHAAKDLRLVTEAAAARGRELKQARANRAWLDEAAERGAGDLDFSAVVATISGEEPSAYRRRLNTTGRRAARPWRRWRLCGCCAIRASPRLSWGPRTWRSWRRTWRR